MNREDFLSKVPNGIQHPSWGYGELEVLVDRKDLKGVCYRHHDNTASYGTYKTTWKELYDDLGPFLVEQGHMKASK